MGLYWDFINAIDSRINCNLSKFAEDIKLSSEVHMREGTHIQRDLYKIKNWIHVNLMRFKKAK